MGDGGDESPPIGNFSWLLSCETVSSKLREQHRYLVLPASVPEGADFFYSLQKWEVLGYEVSGFAAERSLFVSTITISPSPASGIDLWYDLHS
jgi:hypothetical protein